MEYGLIKDTTLQSIGDELRAKDVIPATRKGIVYRDCVDFYCMVTSKDDPMYDNESTYTTMETTITIPGASSFKIVAEAKRKPKDGGGGLGAPVTYIYYNDNNDYFPIASGTDYEIKTKVVEGDSAYIRVHYSGGTSDTKAGVIIKVYPLDADGNEIPGISPNEVDVTNTVPVSTMIEALQAMPKLVPEEAFTITGNCENRFKGWSWFIECYGNKITTKDITNLSNTFANVIVKELPFDINVTNLEDASTPFSGSTIEVCPRIRGTFSQTRIPKFISGVNLNYVRDLNDLFGPEMLDYFEKLKITSAYYAQYGPNLSGSGSVRTVPAWFYKYRLNKESTVALSSSTIYSSAFYGCYSLDEIRDIPVWYCTKPFTSNMFSNTYQYCHRLRSTTFETDNGAPIVVEWKGQTIDLGGYEVGYAKSSSSKYNVIGLNSGVTADKEIKNATTYEALKNDPDCWASKVEYSRYNLTSAIETINSLPDTSAYLASAGGTNTIKFAKNSGLDTDGGGITAENMVEASALAASKGWTVAIIS